MFFSSRTGTTAIVPVNKTQIDAFFMAKRHVYKNIQSEVTVFFAISRTTGVVTIAFDARTHPPYNPRPASSVTDKNRALLWHLCLRITRKWTLYFAPYGHSQKGRYVRYDCDTLTMRHIRQDIGLAHWRSSTQTDIHCFKVNTLCGCVAACCHTTA